MEKIIVRLEHKLVERFGAAPVKVLMQAVIAKYGNNGLNGFGMNRAIVLGS